MQLREAIIAAGMTPPPCLAPGRWLRFPGVGKPRGNAAGWCRVITPTLAIFGDWSSDVRVVWRDDTHVDDATAQRLLREARAREAEFARGQRRRQQLAAARALELIRSADLRRHPYLARKGFPAELGLVTRENVLLVPMRDVSDDRRLLGVQQIDAEGEKLFLAGARASGAVLRLGSRQPRHTLLCEGYATALSLDAAAKRLPGPTAVVVCFSARNLEAVAARFPDAVICADNDQSGTGERAARSTGLPWLMPPALNTDCNDLHLSHGLHAVVELLRPALGT